MLLAHSLTTRDTASFLLCSFALWVRYVVEAFASVSPCSVWLDERKRCSPTRAKGIAQLVGCLSVMHKALGSILSPDQTRCGHMPSIIQKVE